MTKDKFITARIPMRLKSRLDRTGNASAALLEALEEWAAKEDKADARARQALEKAGVLEQVRMCLVTSSPRQGEGGAEWAVRVGIEVGPDATAALDRAARRWR